MALAAAKTFVSAEVLFASDLNTLNTNILNNALALISPLTGNLACGDNDLTGIDELAFTDAAAAVTATGRARRNGSTLDVGLGIVPAAVSGTPAQHGLFRDNVPKVLLRCDAAGTINDSFNVTSIADTGTGLVTVTIDRDFASATYIVTGTAISATIRTIIVDPSGLAAGSFQADCFNDNDAAPSVATDPTNWMLAGFGDQ